MASVRRRAKLHPGTTGLLRDVQRLKSWLIGTVQAGSAPSTRLKGIQALAGPTSSSRLSSCRWYRSKSFLSLVRSADLTSHQHHHPAD